MIGERTPPHGVRGKSCKEQRRNITKTSEMPSRIGSSEAPVPRYADVEAHFRFNEVLFDLKGEAQVVVIPIDD